MSSKVWTKGLALLVLAGGVQAQQPGMKISGFRVPEYDEQGEMTSQLFGDHAEIGSDGEVSITKVRMEFYREGETFMKVESPYCFYNQKTQNAHSDAPVLAEMEGLQLSGRGFQLDTQDRKVNILDESRVVISDVMQQADLEEVDALSGESATNGVTVITSKTLFLDYNARVAHFEETVHVEDPELKMDCESLEMRFGENNKIDWIEALTTVRIFHEGREAHAEHVVYDVKTDEFLLEGNPILIEGRNKLMGDRIRFWRANKKMICEPSARLVFFPGESKNTNIFEK